MNPSVVEPGPANREEKNSSIRPSGVPASDQFILDLERLRAAIVQIENEFASLCFHSDELGDPPA